MSEISEVLSDVLHRPWPLPSGPWLMTQTWADLLFAHWPLPPAALRTLVPAPFSLDLYDGCAWLAVTPFRITHLRGHFLPPLPGLSTFAELNVRTYVTFRDKPGVYFFSLDATSRPAVWAARAFYRLPYFVADISASRSGTEIHYACRRRGHSAAEFKGIYAPVAGVARSEPGSLEHFLTERYCLYAVSSGTLYQAEIHHRRWPLQAAQAEICRNSMTEAAGISLPATPPLLHFARRLKVLIWPPRRLNETDWR